jgi:hypothetical protein
VEIRRVKADDQVVRKRCVEVAEDRMVTMRPRMCVGGDAED